LGEKNRHSVEETEKRHWTASKKQQHQLYANRLWNRVSVRKESNNMREDRRKFTCIDTTKGNPSARHKKGGKKAQLVEGDVGEFKSWNALCGAKEKS